MTEPTNTTTPSTVTLEDVRQAEAHVASYAHRTPVVSSQSLNRIVGHDVFFKCENFQKTGAFKFRGAINSISHLTDQQRQSGVVTHSSGNHAGALAAAAKLFGIKAHIVMPSTSSRVKKAAVIEYGANVIECEPTLESRLEVSSQVQSETGATMIPPFNHPHVIAGQATSALEFHDQVPGLETIVAPVGGGGLISGTCISTRALAPNCRIFGGEPAGADDAFRSKASGNLETNETVNTIADGLRTTLGDLTWPFVRDEVEKIITVTDEEITSAMQLLFDRTKLLVEPSSAVCLAAVMKIDAEKSGRQKIGIIISGGNFDLAKLPW